MSHVCDGWDDCPSGLDEEGCDKVCPYPDYYRCSDSKTCMDSYHVCDGRKDCPNGEDESYYQCSLYGDDGREDRMARMKKSLSYGLALEDIFFRDPSHPLLNGTSSLSSRTFQSSPSDMPSQSRVSADDEKLEKRRASLVSILRAN